MKTRRLLAAATLAALPLVVGALQSGRGSTADADAGRVHSATERPDGPRWHFVTGGGPLVIAPCGTWACALGVL